MTNTATVDYSVGGVNYSAADSETVVTDAGAGNSPPYGVQLSPSSVAENVAGGVVGVAVREGGRAAVDEEIERLKPLIELGGYIPCPDHRIAPDAEWDNVRYYCERMRKEFT